MQMNANGNANVAERRLWPRPVVFRQPIPIIDDVDEMRDVVRPAPEHNVRADRARREAWNDDAGYAIGEKPPRDRPARRGLPSVRHAFPRRRTQSSIASGSPATVWTKSPTAHSITRESA